MPAPDLTAGTGLNDSSRTAEGFLFPNSAFSARLAAGFTQFDGNAPEGTGFLLTRRGKRRPSERLPDLLRDQGLGEYARWSECESTVRELAGDLPDFDSVWLDALVQRELLTSWQASQLQQEHPERLVIGGRQLRSPLGTNTFLALDPRLRSLQVLRRVAVSKERITGLLGRLQGSGVRPPRSVALPTLADSERVGEEIWLAAPWTAGWDMSELLVRGGRLPWECVAEVGRELLQALAWFESAGLLHGEIVLRNVRLTPAGRIVLVDPFSRSLSQPRPTVGQPPELRRCEGIAPELVGSTRPADVRSELHAAGCLLWQLLTARSPAAATDPVRRMLWLRDHDVPDVRGLVPDCPEWLARQIAAMTRRLPELRPVRVAELAAAWSTAAPGGFAGLRRIVHSLPDRRQRQASSRAPRLRKSVSSVRRGLQLSAVLLLAVGVLMTLRPELLTLELRRGLEPRQAEIPRVTPESELESLKRQSAAPQPLPSPDASGVIRLSSGLTWSAGPVRVRGPLRIEADGPGAAVIVVASNRPWILQADAVELRGLQIRQADPSSSAVDSAAVDSGQRLATQLVAVQCNALQIEGCVVQSPSAADEFSGVSWYAPQGGRGRITIRGSVFAGGGYGFAMNQPPETLSLEHVLLACRGGGMLCELREVQHTVWTGHLRHVTQRFGFSVADFVVHDGQTTGPRNLDAELVCDESAFEPRMAVVRVRPGADWTSASMRVRISAAADAAGIPAVVPPDTEPAVYIDRELGQPAALPETQVPDPQLLYAELMFADEGAGPWGSAELLDYEGPRLSDVLPGCHTRQLPILSE